MFCRSLLFFFVLILFKRSRDPWHCVKVSFTGTPSAHVLKAVKLSFPTFLLCLMFSFISKNRKLSGGLAFESVGNDDFSESVFVDEWQASETSILAFVHPGGAGDIAAACAREEFFSHRSVHVLILSALSAQSQEDEVREIQHRLDLLNGSKYPPAPFLVALNHCVDFEAGKDLQNALLARGVIVDVVCINSSSGLGLPELEQLREVFVFFFIWLDWLLTQQKKKADHACRTQSPACQCSYTKAKMLVAPGRAALVCVQRSCPVTI